MVLLAKTINFKRRPATATNNQLHVILDTASTLIKGVDLAKLKADDTCLERWTCPTRRHPDWPAFVEFSKVELPRQGAPGEPKRVAAAPQSKAAAQERNKLHVLTSDLDTFGDPDLIQAEESLSPQERMLVPLLSSVRHAFACGNELLILLAPNTTAAKKLSTNLTNWLQDENNDPSMRTLSAGNLSGALMVQPFARLGLLGRDLEKSWAASQAAQQAIDSARAAGEEPTPEQIHAVTSTRDQLLGISREIITIYDDTLTRLHRVCELFTDEKRLKGLPVKQQTAVRNYGKSLQLYTSMLALPSSPTEQLKALAFSIADDNRRPPRKPVPPPPQGRPKLSGTAKNTVRRQDPFGHLVRPLVPARQPAVGPQTHVPQPTKPS